MAAAFSALVVVYVVAGLMAGLAFVALGIARLQPAPITLGARILLLPGAVLLWPYVLIRWRRARPS